MRLAPVIHTLVAAAVLTITAVSPASAQLLDGPDPAWDAFLATLPDPAPATASAEPLTPAPTPAVGIPTMDPAQRRNAVMVLAVLGLFALLAVPKTRRALLGRVRGATASPTDGVAIEVRATHNVGAGQRIVALEVDGQRLLVGMSPGRMDVLHSWFDGDFAAAGASAPERGFLRAAPEPASAPEPAPAPDDARSAAASVLRAVLDERAVGATPTVARLVDAWQRVESLDDVEPMEPDQPDELPWWLEGATEDEIERHHETEEAPDLASMRRPAASAAPARRAPEVREPARREPRPVEPARTGTDGGRRLARFVLLLAVAVLIPALLGADLAFATDVVAPAMRFEVAGEAGGSNALRLLATLTMLAVAPALILAMTSFTRLIVVFSLLRQAIGVQQAPPNQVLIGMALFLTWFVMGPTFEQVQTRALTPWMDGAITEGQALDEAMVPMREFMFRNTREKDLGLFLQLDRAPRPATRADVPARVLVPAFIISELKTAFQIGFLLYVPFLIIDIVVATVLLAMGMMVLPPVVISLPFKLLLFVFVDGWNLLVGSLVSSFA
jgi:flagellar biosynthetic protein FliP